MHMEDNSDHPPVIIGSESIEFVTSFVYLGSEIFSLSRRSAEDLGWLQMSWEASWDHYGGVMTSDIPSYEVTMPPTSLCYYTTLRQGLSARPSPHATIDLSSMSSGPSKVCTGVELNVLCWMRISAGGADDRASSKTLVSNIFASFVISCKNLMTTPPESSTSLTHHLQTGGDLVTKHTATGPSADQSGAGECFDALPRLFELERQGDSIVGPMPSWHEI